MAWLLPELDEGAEPELKPLELELDEDPDELEPEPVEPELVEPEPVEPELVERELVEPEPELVEPELVEPELAEPEPVLAEPEVAAEVLWWVEPGRANVSAPAVTTLAMPTAVVAERTLFRPRSLAAMARRMPSRCSLLMCSILRLGVLPLLEETSRLAMKAGDALAALPAGGRGYSPNMKNA